MNLRIKLQLILLLFFAFSISAQETKKEVDEMPSPIGGVKGIMEKVVYPSIAKDEGIQGKVFVKAFIDEAGNVATVEIIKGVEELNSAAIKAVRNTKFVPAKSEGKSVKAEVTIPIFFKLDDCKKTKS